MLAWYRCLPPAVTRVPCGDGVHTLRWADGSLELPDHPDAEAERVLAALGGDKPACLELAEIWNRHTDDAELLAVLPRSAADEVEIGWQDVAAYRDGPAGRGVIAYGSAVRRISPRVGGSGWTAYSPLAGPPPPPVQQTTAGQMPARMQQVQAEMRARNARRIELLTLLALGPEFQLRLAGQIAGSLAPSPALSAALAGRVGPAVGAWLGVDPGTVAVTPHAGPGWGTIRADEDGVRVALPVSWLPNVWACDLAVIAGHLVVSVTDPGWPDAKVLALAEPDAAPVSLTLHGTADHPRWVRH